jgi:hypothetical protein
MAKDQRTIRTYPRSVMSEAHPQERNSDYKFFEHFSCSVDLIERNESLTLLCD